MKDIFLPFTIDKKFWNKNMPIVFLNKVYEAQIGEDEKNIQYKTIATYHPKNMDRCANFSKALVKHCGRILNQYHGITKSDYFWYANLYLWVRNYVCSMRSKLDQLIALEKNYNQSAYRYYTRASKNWRKFDLLSLEDNHNGIFFEEAYNFISYLYLAEKYFNINIEEMDINLERQTHNKTLRMEPLDRVRAFKRKLLIIMDRVIPGMQIGLMGSQGDRWSWLQWFLRSKGKIQRIILPDMEDDAPVDYIFRNHLAEDLTELQEFTEEEKMIVEFLPRVFPKSFVEDFKAQYDTATKFLEAHKDLSVILGNTEIVTKSAQKICMVLLQERGGKILGQQHGGTYVVTLNDQYYLLEEELNDVFYYWGRCVQSRKDIELHKSRLLFAPSYTLERDRRVQMNYSKKGNTGYFLFVGTAVEAYVRCYNYGDVDGEKEQYISRKMRFLSTLSEAAMVKLVVREYPRDFGWHMVEKIKSEYPAIRVSTRQRFEDILAGCELYISDHLATTWLQAINLEKPTVFLLPDYECSIQNTLFREEEKPYIKMLEKVGIIIHIPEQAAALVNHLAEHGVMQWWMDEERQRVVKLVRERWTTRVKDIDDWWYHELIAQAEKVEYVQQ